MKNDGGFQPAGAPAANGGLKNDGGFQPAGAPAANGGLKNDGGFQRAGEGPSAAAKSVILSAAPSSAPGKPPCEGCGKVVGISVGAGSKDAARIKLLRALDAIASFVLDLYDAAILEAPGGVAKIREHDVHDEPWRDFGFTVSAHDGALAVSSVIGDTPASKAGIEVGDVFALVEDISCPATIEAFSDAWRKGNKWKDHRVRILRHGAPLDMSLND